MVQETITFLAILALIALGGAVVILVAMRTAPDGTVVSIGPNLSVLAAAVAIVATLGSLFMSEIAGFTPCLLCWIQRGFMYPLALAFLLRRRLGIPPLWLMAWAAAGSLVSAYHYAEEHIPAFANSSFCAPELPCSFIWFERFGFVTLPFMAFCGFIAIAAFMFAERRLDTANSHIRRGDEI